MGTKKEFIEKVLDLISTSAIKMGLKPDAPTLAILSKEFASILITNNKLKTLAFEQVQEAFNDDTEIVKANPIELLLGFEY